MAKENPKQRSKPGKQIFVAYAYNLYPRNDYRKVFSNLEKLFGVKFIFADEKITNMHILAKIESYIQASDFSIFDISAWNPNVTLELGIALARSDEWYICFNPEKTDLNDVPSDIRGIDRIQYSSFTELEERLTLLLDDRYARSVRRSIEDYFGEVQDSVTSLVQRQPGLKRNEIAEILKVNTKVIQTALSELLSKQTIRSEGRTRATRYYTARTKGRSNP